MKFHRKWKDIVWNLLVSIVGKLKLEINTWYSTNWVPGLHDNVTCWAASLISHQRPRSKSYHFLVLILNPLFPTKETWIWVSTTIMMSPKSLVTFCTEHMVPCISLLILRLHWPKLSLIHALLSKTRFPHPFTIESSKNYGIWECRPHAQLQEMSFYRKYFSVSDLTWFFLGVG